MNKIRIKSVISLVIVIIAIFSFSQPLFAYTVSYEEVFGNYPPYTLSYGCCPLNNWPQINSKWNQPRNVGSSPHEGVDAYAITGTDVSAVWNGWVEWKDTDKIRFRIDINRDGIKNDTLYYCDYYHLSSRKPSGYYAMAANIGKTADKNHLHFGVLNSNLRWCRNESNYRFTNYWNSGRDVDVFSREEWTNNTCKITIYFKDDGAPLAPKEVKIYHRRDGTSTWTDGGKMTYKGNNIYSYNFTGYKSGTKINWLVRIYRSGINENVYCPYAFAPAKYYRPHPNPNASSYAYAYFTNTIQ